MVRLTARAIRVGDFWLIEIPSRRLRVVTRTLDEVDGRVGPVFNRRSRSGPQAVSVDIAAFLHVDDRPSGLQSEIRHLVACAALRQGGPPRPGAVA